VFKDGEIAKQMLDTQWLQHQIRNKVSIREARSLGVDYLIIRKAYLQSDIIWSNLKVNVIVAIIKRSLLFLILFLLSLLILTPAYAISLLDPLKLLVESWFKNSDVLVEFVGEYFGPMIVLIINFGIIPFMIDVSSAFEGFRRKSSR